MAADFRAFTGKYNGIARVLTSKASVGVAFDPSRSPDPALHEFDAIWDTGATGSVISQNVVRECGLNPIGMTRVSTAGGVRTSNEYLVSIYLPNEVAFPTVRVTVGDIEGADVLIGMDIIGIGDFAVTNHEGKTVFSFRFPSVARIDFVEEAKRIKRARAGNRAQRRKAARKSKKKKGY